MIFANAFSYYKAVKDGDEPPFPHATVTSTACHYPQDIVFRFIMLLSSSIMCLAFYVIFRWL